MGFWFSPSFLNFQVICIGKKAYKVALGNVLDKPGTTVFTIP